ncbi:MAG: polysaccharide biosynthesis tyrosine autokinase [Desulforhopalus sp.]
MGKTSKVLGKSGYSFDVQGQSDVATIADKSVRSVADLEKKPFVTKKVPVETFQRSSEPTAGWDERLIKATSSSCKAAESFRVLRSKILLPQDGKPAPKTIMVTSALPREGKSFVSANLGIALAQGVDQHSLIVDCDLRAPSLAQLFGVSVERGLVDYLQGHGEISAFLRKTSMEKLSILASGLPPVNPAELLGSSRMHKLVEELANRYPDRYVIFDTPPLEVASESKVLSQAVDGVVLVVRQGVSNKALIDKFISDIGKERIIGVIFNGHKSNFISTRLVDKSHYYYGNYYNNQIE